jgi:hypothetical protein
VGSSVLPKTTGVPRLPSPANTAPNLNTRRVLLASGKLMTCRNNKTLGDPEGLRCLLGVCCNPSVSWLTYPVIGFSAVYTLVSKGRPPVGGGGGASLQL